MESDYRIKGGEVWTGISKLNESHFTGRPGGIPFEPLNILYPTVLQSYPVVLNQIALGPCTKLRLYNRTKKSVQKLKNVGIKEMILQRNFHSFVSLLFESNSRQFEFQIS